MKKILSTIMAFATAFALIQNVSAKDAGKVENPSNLESLGAYTELPAGTNGSFGTSGKYVTFGTFPQTLKDSSVTVSQTADPVTGYYLGSDGWLYAKTIAHTYGDALIKKMEEEKTALDKSKVDYKKKLANYDKEIAETKSRYKFEKGKEYYFRVEPIKWRVIKEQGGAKTLFSEKVLDAHAFNTANDSDIFPNNYEMSDLRSYLNGGDKNSFIEKAFNQNQKGMIQTQKVENNSESAKNYVKLSPEETLKAKKEIEKLNKNKIKLESDLKNLTRICSVREAKVKERYAIKKEKLEKLIYEKVVRGIIDVDDADDAEKTALIFKKQFKELSDEPGDIKAVWYAHQFKQSELDGCEEEIKNLEEKIAGTKVDVFASEEFICNDTDDKIFALSVNEVTNPNFGFKKFDAFDSARCKMPTDYAIASGAYFYNYKDGTSWYWLRSPSSASPEYVRISGGYAGSDGSGRTASTTRGGVAPALTVIK